VCGERERERGNQFTDLCVGTRTTSKQLHQEHLSPILREHAKNRVLHDISASHTPTLCHQQIELEVYKQKTEIFHDVKPNNLFERSLQTTVHLVKSREIS
jgi:hypothetical protein